MDSRLTRVVGDRAITEPVAAQLVRFIERNHVEVVSPAHWRSAWIWAAQLGDKIEHEPIRLVTVVSPAPLEVVRLVACLTMRGEIDHVMSVSARSASVIPMASPAEMREEIRTQPSDWWACPFRNTARCLCVPPSNQLR